MPVCSKCSAEKSVDLFYRDTSRPKGITSHCRACRARYDASVYPKKKKVSQERSALRRAAGKRISDLKSVLKNRYGLSLEEYRDLQNIANGCCQICGEVPAHKLCVDHCHKTRKVRGLLCRPCNQVLGFAKDSAVVLENAIRYLTR